ncbi:fanconi-associated nuclease 1-like [Dysidea avara]|uniref:fanconi-associated nuclease 1-like n=1 Tax=Dysidea avara TaxID=196820 RepID=UPI003321D91C
MDECQPSPAKRVKVSEGDDEKDNIEQLSSPYYLDNLKFILDCVLGSDSVDKNALKEEDVSCTQKFRALEGSAQRLFIRLFLRKHQWIISSRIKYPRIASDLKPILQSLVQSGFLQDESKLTELPIILDLLTIDNLKMLCKNLKVVYNSSKRKTVEALIKHSNSYKPIFGSKSAGSVVFTKAKSQLGSCVRVDDTIRQALHKTILLFSLPTMAFDMDEPQSIIYRLLQVNIGSVVFPSYPILISRPLFESSEHYDRYYLAYCCEQSLTAALEAKNTEEINVTMDNTLKKFHNILGLKFKPLLGTSSEACIDLTDESNGIDSANVPVVQVPESLFSQYTEGSVYAKMLSSCVEYLEKCRLYGQANELLERLLSQSVYCVGSRGRWWERLALNLDQHLKKHSESVDVIVRALDDPSVKASRRLSLLQRAKRLSKHVKTGTNNKIKRLPDIDYISAPVVEVKAKMHSRREPGFKSHFILSEGDTTSIFLSVESLAISHYQQTEGWSHAVHAEGATFSTLFGVLFWNVVFGVEVPDVFRNAFQAGPLDYFTKKFYINRKETVDLHLQWISTASSQMDLIWLVKMKSFLNQKMMMNA